MSETATPDPASQIAALRQELERAYDQMNSWLWSQFDDALEAVEKDVQMLTTERDRLRAERRWIPVEERLPDEGAEVLVRIERDGRTGVMTAYRCDGGWIGLSLMVARHYVTHWQPMPSTEVEG